MSPWSPEIWVTCLSGVLSTCILGPVHMSSWGLVHVSRPILRLNSSSVKIIISKLLCPKDVGGAGGTQRPLPSLILGASSPHPQEDSSPGGSTDSSDLPPDTAQALWGLASLWFLPQGLCVWGCEMLKPRGWPLIPCWGECPVELYVSVTLGEPLKPPESFSHL